MKFNKLAVLLLLAISACKQNEKEPLIHGYTTAQRQEIYTEGEHANDRAVKEAEENYYPHELEDELKNGKWNSRRDEFDIKFKEAIDAFSAKKRELKDAYITQVAKQYSLTYEYMDTLFIEGMKKNWPSIYNK